MDFTKLIRKYFFSNQHSFSIYFPGTLHLTCEKQNPEITKVYLQLFTEILALLSVQLTGLEFPGYCSLLMSLNGGIKTVSPDMSVAERLSINLLWQHCKEPFWNTRREKLWHIFKKMTICVTTKNIFSLLKREILILNTCMHKYVCAKNSWNIWEITLSSLNVSMRG